MNKKQKTELTISELLQAKQIFDKKGWPFEDEFQKSKFEDFCELLCEYDDEKKGFILELTEKFIWIRETDYIVQFRDVFNTFISKTKIETGKTIIICPLIPENDFGKSKSSIALFYLIKSKISVIQEKYPNYNISFIDNPKIITSEQIKDNVVLCLVDDFIGSGTTAILATEYFLNKKIPMDKIVILSIVAMKEGIEKLKTNKYNAYANIECDKGITGTINEKRNTELMQSIEEKICVEKEFKFGYSASEALVSMIRTPNNTFPIYWFKNKKKGYNLHAPFPR